MKLLYHGSKNAQIILQKGFDIDHPRIRDVGDFGWGIYLTGNLARAGVMAGKDNVLDVLINESKYAYIRYPYFLKGMTFMPPETPEEQLFYDLVYIPETGQLRTVKGDQQIAKQVRTTFLEKGFTGIITPHSGVEAVVFNTNTIKDIRKHS